MAESWKLFCNTIVEPIKTFHDSTHARQRSRERNISLETTKDVVKYHQSKTQQYRGNHGGFVYKFKKTVEGKILAVVAEIKKDECWLMSGFYVE